MNWLRSLGHPIRWGSVCRATRLDFGIPCGVVGFPRGAFDIVWKRLEAPKEWARSQELFAGAAFAYDVLLKDHAGVHQWMFRRLTAFNIAATSICGLLLSFLFGHCVVGITWTLAWCFPVVVFAFILGVTAWVAWHDAMDMFDFMISLESAKEAGTGSAPRSAELAADRK